MTDPQALSHLLPLLVALPFAGAALAALLPANARNAEAWLAGAVALGAVGIAWWLGDAVRAGQVVRAAYVWLPSLGLDLSFRVDGFAWLFVLLVAGIGFLVVLYARYYMSPDDPVPRFFGFFLAFMGAMLGVVTSGNLVQLVFFWELTSLFSFLLIGYWYQNPNAREGARMALVVTSAGGLCLLAGVLVIGHIAGSYELDAVLAAGERIRAHPLYTTALVLVLLGAFTKSAQFPFHFWLPHAMAAPTPVSAYLHSAAMVKLGIFLMTRLFPVLSGTDAWIWLVGGAGVVTFVFGAYAAIFQNDLKGLLAYSTISHLGLITLLLGFGTTLGCVAAIFHTLNHATFKASLFMAAGVIDHETGTRDIRRLSGLVRFMPITAALAMIAAAAMAGVPLLNGFISKEMFFAEALEPSFPPQQLDHAMPYVVTLAGMFSVAYSLRFIHGAFFGPDPVDLPKAPHDPTRWMLLPIACLAVACLVVGVLPGYTVRPLLDVAARSVLGLEMPAYSLAVWHGFNVPFMMSLAALAGGALLYVALLRYFAKGREEVPLVPPVEGRRVFERLMAALSLRWSRAFVGALGTRDLQPQLLWMVLIGALAVAVPVGWHGIAAGAGPGSGADPVFAAIWVVGAACALGAAWQAKFHRLAALMLTGGAGIATCLTFVWFSAPDLALTQLLVEIVTTILILLGLRWLPQRSPYDWTWQGALRALPRRVRDLGVAVAAGGGLALLSYAVMTRPRVPDSIADAFVARALPEGGGSNIVNVILVDFRGFDTLVEITVLAVVALAVFALLRRFRPARESLGQPPQQAGQTATTIAHDLLVPGVLMRLMFPVSIVLSLYLLWRGHNLPGGGFVAGLVLAVGFLLQYMALGTRTVEDRLRIRPVRWMGVGLLLAGVTGCGAWWFAHPFLTSHTAHLTLPLIGELHVPSAFAFDLGVYAVVIGATVLMLIAQAHQSIRSDRPPRVPTT